MDGSADDVTPATNSPHPLGRHREFLEAMVAAKLSIGHQRILGYIADTTDPQGIAHTTLAIASEKLGYSSRGTVWEAVNAGRVAGFLETIPHPTDRRRTLWRIPRMVAPDSENSRGTTARLTGQSRGGSEKSRGGTARSRGPGPRAIYRDKGMNRERAEFGVIHSPTRDVVERRIEPEIAAAIEETHRQLRETRADRRRRWAGE